MNTKKTYKQPEIVTIALDNEISIQLASIVEDLDPMVEPNWGSGSEIIDPLEGSDPFLPEP